MKIKTKLIMKRLKHNNTVKVKMDKAFGHEMLIIHRKRGTYIVGTHKPNKGHAVVDKDNLIYVLDANSIYIEGMVD